MWKISKSLGRGNYGFVSLAISQPNDDPIPDLPCLMAVKSAEIFQLDSLKKESNLLTKLHDCPHILRCFGDFVSDNSGVLIYNILLEYASGGSLADHIKISSGGFPEYEVRWYTKSILIGLSHIHKQGYVHCDIKPHNILLVGGSSSLSSRPRRIRFQDEKVKIADFGLAKKQKEEENKAGFRGTPLYMAPECVLFQECETYSDVWALGCTVLQMITGKPAWKCDSDTETCALLFRIGFTSQVPEIPRWISEEGRDFLRKCLVRDPKSRWTADMLLSHPFVSSKMMVPIRESVKKESK